MGSQQICSFIGRHHKDDRALYVSAEGFSKNAAMKPTTPLKRTYLPA